MSDSIYNIYSSTLIGYSVNLNGIFNILIKYLGLRYNNIMYSLDLSSVLHIFV